MQPIPLFEELVELLMEVSHPPPTCYQADLQPANQHVILNVRLNLVKVASADAQIDCKMQNDPERLFVSRIAVPRQTTS